MAKLRLGWWAAVLAAALATCLDRPRAGAAEESADYILAKHGLKMAGSLAVAIEEANVKTKLTEARRLSKQLRYSITQQQGTMSSKEQQQQIKTVNEQIGQLRSEINAVNQQMSRIPRGGGRYGSRYGGGNSFTNNYAAEMYAELAAYKNQLQMELNQDSLLLNQIKTQSADPKAKEKIDTEVRDRRDAYHQVLLDLRKLVDAANARYDEAAKNDDVKHALSLWGKGTREKATLGPSHEFRANIKLLEKFEKAESSGETDETATRTSRRSRMKGKSSLKAAASSNHTS